MSQSPLTKQDLLEALEPIRERLGAVEERLGVIETDVHAIKTVLRIDEQIDSLLTITNGRRPAPNGAA